MQRIFGDQQGQSLLLYLDDIVVFSSTVHQHLQWLDVVLGWLQQDRLKTKLSKCAFFQPEVHYLGHVITASGVSTDPSKIEAVVKGPLLRQSWSSSPSRVLQVICRGLGKTGSPPSSPDSYAGKHQAQAALYPECH